VAYDWLHGSTRALPVTKNRNCCVGIGVAHSLDTLQKGSLQNLHDLFNAETIPSNDRGVFYAQSASVVEFLRERLGIRDTLTFARMYALKGAEPALREIAGYATVGDLQLAWSEWLLK